MCHKMLFKDSTVHLQILDIELEDWSNKTSTVNTWISPVIIVLNYCTSSYCLYLWAAAYSGLLKSHHNNKCYQQLIYVDNLIKYIISKCGQMQYVYKYIT
jgi:hypothetical protein